jgi:hypothetical protein
MKSTIVLNAAATVPSAMLDPLRQRQSQFDCQRNAWESIPFNNYLPNSIRKFFSQLINPQLSKFV